ncbi:MAG: RidA family protein [Holophaga sp.]|jgi:enamine deaminase RidA (YjgF/YER057c/UK114 family)
MTERFLLTPIMHRAVEHNGLVFLGGTTCDDPTLDMGGQTREVLKKIEGHLALAGTDKANLLSATIFVTDLSKKSEMDTAWKEWLPPTSFPARATVGVANLGGGALIEVIIIAHK